MQWMQTISGFLLTTERFQMCCTRKLSFILSFLFVFSLGCPPTTEITPVPIVITDTDACGPACDTLIRLNCSEGKPITMKQKCDAGCTVGQYCDRDGGFCTTPCKKFCEDTQHAGVWLDPSCVVNITSCDQVNKCPLAQKKN